MNKLLKSLQTFALAYNEGKCSVDTLIKACGIYKAKTGFVDNLEYELKVAKSCIDSINGVERDDKICKAIIPGQTKVVDGILYVYSATKKGSKTEYDWHIVRQGAKTNASIGRSGTLTDVQIKGKQKYINELFPNDLSTLKVVKTLGGSTGAQLVEDADGNQYVMKKGTNTNADHVKAEYLTNQLYNVMGLRTPDYELYEDNGNPILLSRFIPGTHMPNSGDFAKMGEGFIADVLLANWDVYMNDNCLVNNATGAIYRVDNGGSLNFRAKGQQKVFDGDVLTSWKGMVKYNPMVYNTLTEDDQLNQIIEISKKKDDVVNFLTESGRDDLAKILSERFDNLSQIANELNRKKNAAAQKAAARMGKMPPRVLKSATDMYKELDDKTITELLDKTATETGYAASSDTIFTATNSQNAWAFLTNICKERGFDARPDVVTETEFWKKNSESKWPLILRGFGSTSYKDDFQISDFFHAGRYGIWGQGVYAHSDDKSRAKPGQDGHTADFIDNKSDATNWKKSPVYSGSGETALGYAANKDCVARLTWAKDANVINSEDLLDEIKAIGASKVNSPKAKKLKKELDEIKKEWTQNELDLLNVSDIVKKEVFTKIGYDEEAVKDMTDYLDSIDWGSRNAQGKRNYPMFDEAVVKHIIPAVTKCGGKATILNAGEEDEQVHFEIGGEDFWLSKYSWNNNAVKQKNNFTKPYHLTSQRFTTFFDTNCVKPANDALQKELSSGKKAAELKAKVAKNKQDYYNKEKEYNDEINVGSSNGKVSGKDVYSRIYNIVKNQKYRDSGNVKSLLGVYAALKGYDGIYQPDGNGSGHGFVIILNRSKIVTVVD